MIRRLNTFEEITSVWIGGSAADMECVYEILWACVIYTAFLCRMRIEKQGTIELTSLHKSAFIQINK